MEATCDYVVVLQKGRLVRQGTLEEIIASASRHGLTIEVAPEEIERTVRIVSSLDAGDVRVQDGAIVTNRTYDDPSRITRALAEEGIYVRGLRSQRASLEEAFLGAHQGRRRVNAELAKLRYLPLPRLIGALAMGSAIVAGIVLIAWAPTDERKYTLVAEATINLVFVLCAIVLGVWSSTLEFGAGTLQRTLTGESNRHRVLASKLLVVLAAATAVGVAAAATATGLTDIAASRAGIELNDGHLARVIFANVAPGILGAAVGFGFGLLARSMGGGITLALVFAFVLDGFLGLVPGIGDYTWGRLSSNLTNHLADEGATDYGLAVALLGALAWAAAVVVPGWIRFVRGDLK